MKGKQRENNEMREKMRFSLQDQYQSNAHKCNIKLFDSLFKLPQIGIKTHTHQIELLGFL